MRTNPMRGLKILVIVMAVMILAGSATLIAVVTGRLSRSEPATGPAQPFAAAPIELSAGARIETIGVGSDRLVLEIVLPDGERQLLIIDLATGRRLGTIPLRSAP
jgi:hypothetical protein